MLNKIACLLENKKLVVVTYTILVLFICIRAIIFSKVPGGSIGNNYLIFKNSFQRLIDNQSLYVYYTNLDLFKYSPTFAVCMLPIHYINDYVGIFFWTIINTLIVVFAFLKLPKLDKKYIVFALWFIINELATALMNCQTNPFIVGLIILGIIAIENKKVALSTLLIMIAFFIKPYAAAACMMYIFYTDKLKIVLFSVFWFLLLAAMPFIFISYDSYLFQLVEWKIMLQNDHAASYGLSVMSLLKNNLNVDAKNSTILIGTLVLFVPLYKINCYKSFDFRINFLASILIWLVIFNHKAESPTFIIAVCGVALWYFYGEKSKTNLVLLLFVLVLTQLGNTDVYSAAIRNEWMQPRALKALPCFLVWLKVNYELLAFQYKKEMVF